VRAVERGEYIAHLFDQNLERLEKTARRLGINIVVIEKPGTDSQHVDLCGRPLRRALAEIGEEALGAYDKRQAGGWQS
jgi:hypothetical protein